MLATFFVQITMLNMLIAIMGDTFERIISNKELNSRMMRLRLMSEQSGILSSKFKSEHDNECFLYLVVVEDS